MNGWIYMNGRMDEWHNKWMNIYMNGRMDEGMLNYPANTKGYHNIIKRASKICIYNVKCDVMKTSA